MVGSVGEVGPLCPVHRMSVTGRIVKPQKKLFIHEAAISGDGRASLKFTTPRIRLSGFCLWQSGEGNRRLGSGLHTCNQLHQLSLVTHRRDVIYTLETGGCGHEAGAGTQGLVHARPALCRRVLSSSSKMGGGG